MTEVEVKQAAEEHFSKIHFGSKNYKDWAMKCFVSGAEFATPKWIPVTERMPSFGLHSGISIPIWFTNDDSVFEGAYCFNIQLWEDRFMRHFRTEEITHWMPKYIPSPPNTKP